MELVGFKSFGEKSVIAFPPGISAIVGPNGCGKSNIVDALRWAMGEMSVKQLRGKSMEDIIFAGANGRPPMNLAEVSLTLSNENGTAPEAFKHFSEIMLTRRLYRSGESLYMINRQPCRLKDIHNIFLGSGMGAKSYAVIQQGNIGAITDAGPEERRFFIEEAAGVTRYKQRKKETLRKLDATHQNLLRVRDIVSEVERQMKGLDRQARKAEQYRKYQEKIRILDLHLSITAYDGYSERIKQNDDRLRGLKDADIAYTTRLNRLNAAVEEIKLRRSRKNQEISTQRSHKFELQRRIDRAESDLSHRKNEIDRLIQEAVNLRKLYGELASKNQKIIEERTTVDQHNQALREEIAQIKDLLTQEEKGALAVRNRLAELREAEARCKNHLMTVVGEEAKFQNICRNALHNQEHLKRRLRKIDEDEALASSRLKEIETQATRIQESLSLSRSEIGSRDQRILEIRACIDAGNRTLSDQVKRVQALEYDRHHTHSRHAALKKMAENYEWYRDGVKTIMTGADPSEILGLIADVIDPSAGVIPAIEAVLGEALEYVLVRDAEVGGAAIDRLREENAGRGGFVPVAALRQPDSCLPGETPNLLLNHLKAKSGFEDVVHSLLGNVVLTDSLEAAIESHRRNGNGATFVTREGDVVSHHGVMIGGSSDRLSGILMKKQEMSALEGRLTELNDALADARTVQETLEIRVRDLEKNLHLETEEKNEAVKAAFEAEKSLIKVTETLKHAGQTLERLRMEQDQLLEESDHIDEEMRRCHTALSRTTEAVKAAQAEVVDIERDTAAVSSDFEGVEARIVDVKLRLTARTAAMENGLNAARRLKEFQADGDIRLEQLLKDIEIKEGKRREMKAGLATLESSLQGLHEEIRRLDEVLKSSEADYEETEALLRARGDLISEVQGLRNETVDKIRTIEMEQSQLHIKRETVESRVAERYQRPLAAFRPELADLDLGRGMTVDETAAALEELRRKLERIGDVHLGAIDEYKALTERHEFLKTQQADLVKAVDDLHKVIRKINRVSQDKFLDTFARINEKLEEVFPRLFSGGSARLILTEPNDPLETGVEFMVHPPGKKLTRLTLLSGGEKALSAIAFVFSIFLIKPASFCIMDEIDAPLDEANVYRFNELLRIIGENSQIIMITHKKKSMEFADTLFGITMEQKGVSRIVSVNLEGQAAPFN
ncbi:chromosome segregation protein SMC [Desulfococcus sp.]|nr:Smc: predicted chromosome partition protein [Desulfococcus multivorans]